MARKKMVIEISKVVAVAAAVSLSLTWSTYEIKKDIKEVTGQITLDADIYVDTDKPEALLHVKAMKLDSIPNAQVDTTTTGEVLIWIPVSPFDKIGLPVGR